MAKNDLLGGSLWDQYSNKVTTLMNNPINQGEITQEECDSAGHKLIVADFGAESCGDAVRLYWEVDPANDTIVNSKFKSFGCGTAIASSDMMAELCIGKTVQQAVKITNIDVEMSLRDDPETPAVPPQKMLDAGAQTIYPAHGKPFPAERLRQNMFRIKNVNLAAFF